MLIIKSWVHIGKPRHACRYSSYPHSTISQVSHLYRILQPFSNHPEASQTWETYEWAIQSVKGWKFWGVIDNEGWMTETFLLVWCKSYAVQDLTLSELVSPCIGWDDWTASASISSSTSVIRDRFPCRNFSCSEANLHSHVDIPRIWEPSAF